MALLTSSTRVMGNLLDLDFFSLPLDYLSNPYLSLVVRKSSEFFEEISNLDYSSFGLLHMSNLFII